MGKRVFGCGQCLPCRINRRRLWQSRMMLETLGHGDSCFVTLTYADEKLPDGGTLDRRHVALFLKRLRKAWPSKLRYYLVGEYGEGWRPHYHIIIWGISYLAGNLVRRCWGMGDIHIGDVTKDSIGYVAGYTVKKLTNPKDEKLLIEEVRKEVAMRPDKYTKGLLAAYDRRGEMKSLYPEFCRMSRHPGIGALVIRQIGKKIKSNKFSMNDVLAECDVPGTVKFGGKEIAIGRYLKSELRKEVGIDEEEVKRLTKINMLIEADMLIEEESKKRGFNVTLAEAHSRAFGQKIRQSEIRYKIRMSKKRRIL